MRILFPLRSSAAQFESPQTLDLLRSRLKRALLVYDEVIVQDGQLQLIVWEDGNLEFDLPPHAIPTDRGKIRFKEAGQESAFQVKHPETGDSIPILQGQPTAYFHADYWPLIEESGLLGEHFLQLTTFGVPDSEKERLRTLGRKRASEPRIREALPNDLPQLSRMAEGLHIDSALATSCSASIAVDDRVARLVAAQNRVLADDRWSNDVRERLLEALCSVSLPDPATMEWQEIAELRESAPGRDLRHKLTLMAAELAGELANVEDPRDADLIAARHVFGEVVQELQSLMPSSSRMALGLLVNLNPVAGLVGSVAELVNAIEVRQSWVTLLRSQRAAAKELPNKR